MAISEWQWLIELAASALAAVTRFLATKGVQVSPEDIASRARSYITANTDELKKAEGEYLDRFRDPPP